MIVAVCPDNEVNVWKARAAATRLSGPLLELKSVCPSSHTRSLQTGHPERRPRSIQEAPRHDVAELRRVQHLRHCARENTLAAGSSCMQHPGMPLRAVRRQGNERS